MGRVLRKLEKKVRNYETVLKVVPLRKQWRLIDVYFKAVQ